MEEDADAQLPSSDTPEAFSSPLKRMKVDSTGTGVATKSRDPPMGTFRTGNALKSSPPVSKGNTAAPKTPKGKVAKTPLTVSFLLNKASSLASLICGNQPRSRRTAKSINATQTSSDIEDGDNEQEIPYPGITTRRRSPVKYPTPDTSISTLTSLTSSPSDDNNTQHPNRRSQNSTLSNSISDVSENEEGKASEESALQRKFREMEEYKSQLEQQQKLREERKSQWNQDKRGLELLCEAVEEVEGRAF